MDYRHLLGVEARSLLSALMTLANARMAANRLPYHASDHVNDMLTALNMAVGTPTQELITPSLVAAVVYHDVVYVPGFKGNEEASALALRYDCSKLSGYVMRAGWVSSAIGAVLDVATAERLILDTTIARHLDSDYDATASDLIRDLDLSSLGTPDFGKFVHNQARLAMEFCVSIEETVVLGVLKAQSVFLAQILAKKNIYRLPEYRALYEDRARSNIEKFSKYVTSGDFKWQSALVW